MAGRHPGVMSGVAYGASKAGAVSVSHSINAEERVNGIRACTILPGEVATAILDQRPNPPSAEARGAMLQPEDVAAAVVFVATQPHRVTIDELWITPTIQRDRAVDEAPRVAEERS
jgi:NADP-dependent 3-hydroxy acid dehydrogenase YdfG